MSQSDPTSAPVPATGELLHNLIFRAEPAILEDFALRKELLEEIETCLLDGIEALAGTSVRSQVAEAGLAQMHRFFPVEKVLRLEEFFLRRLRPRLNEWSYRVGRDDLSIEGEFFVDHLIVPRIHYPFLVAREAGAIEQPGYPWAEKARAARADLGNPRMLANRLSDLWHKTLAGAMGLRDERVTYDAARFYHRGLPSPARAHGPHLDTWYGHSFDGLNLWLSIDGVNSDNTVLLYPELFGQSLEYDPRSMYLAEGIPLPRPQKVEIAPGQLLVFNPEILHGTQVNISDETRVALTTRINPEQPRFNPHADFHFQHWRSSTDLAQGRRNRIRVFPKSQYPGKASIPARTSTQRSRKSYVRVPERLAAGQAVRVGPADLLPADGKLMVDLENARLLIVRRGDELVAMQRKCPHLGVDLSDGHHDDTQIFCPGHGIAFALDDGRSHCAALSLRLFRAAERDGFIEVERAGRAPAANDRSEALG